MCCERLFLGKKEMFIKDLNECEPFLAGDATRLRELLHPDKADIKINYSLAHAVVKPGQTSLRHRLSTTEVYYILTGEGIMHIDEETAHVRPGQAIYIPPHAVQFIHNTGSADLRFLCIVDPAWRQKDEEIIS
jgi:mannose-6-phosphate isomerase-like protein (cupin superfamily)